MEFLTNTAMRHSRLDCSLINHVTRRLGDTGRGVTSVAGLRAPVLKNSQALPLRLPHSWINGLFITVCRAFICHRFMRCLSKHSHYIQFN